MDRRTVWAILLMMVIAIAPALFLKKPAQRGSGAAGQRGRHRSVAASGCRRHSAAPTACGCVPAPRIHAAPRPRGPATADDTVSVTSPLYTYGISTRGARLVQAELRALRLHGGGERDRARNSCRRTVDLLSLTVVRGRDTVRFQGRPFTRLTSALSVNRPDGAHPHRGAGRRRLELTYTFQPDDYRIDVKGQATDIGPNGGAAAWWEWAPPSTTPRPTRTRTTATWRWSPSATTPSAPISAAWSRGSAGC